MCATPLKVLKHLRLQTQTLFEVALSADIKRIGTVLIYKLIKNEIFKNNKF